MKIGHQTLKNNIVLRLLKQVNKSRIGKETIWSGLLKIIFKGISLLTTILLTKTLEPTDYGIYVYIIVVVSLLAVPSQFGLPLLLIRETSRGIANKKYSEVRGIWQWSGRISLLISVGLASLAFFTINFWQGDVSSLFIWAILLVPLIALGNLRGAALRGLHHIVAGQIPEFLLRPGLFLFFIIGINLFGKNKLNISTLMALNVLAATVAFVVGAWILSYKTPPIIHAATPHYKNRIWFLSALPFAFIASMQLINQRASILILGPFVPASDIGVYQIALQISTLAAFGLQTMNMVVTPRFARIYAQGDMIKLQHIVTQSTRAIFFFTLVVTIFLLLFGKLLLTSVFDPIYGVAYYPLVVLLGGQLINAVVGSVGFLLNMTGHERIAAKSMGVVAVLNILLSLLLIPYLGIMGAASATSISLIIRNISLWWIARKKLNINTLPFNTVKKAHYLP